MGQRSTKYLVLVLEVGILLLAGYLGARRSPGFQLPAPVRMGGMILAAGAGVAAFFSPCSFPLLLFQLRENVSRDAGVETREGLYSVRYTLGFALGIVCFFVVTGDLFGWMGQQLFGTLPYTETAWKIVRIVLGILLVSLGLVQTNLIIVDFRIFPRITSGLLRIQAGLRQKHPLRGGALFGYTYPLAGFG